MSAADDLLRTGLRRIQDRLARGVDAGRLVQCLMIHSPISDKTPTSQPPEFSNREPLCFGHDTYGSNHIHRDRSGQWVGPADTANRSVHYFGDQQGYDEFFRLATDAGNLVSSMSNKFFPVSIPQYTLETAEPATRWLYVLFDLAWAEIPGSPLRPSKGRTAWSGRTSIALDALPLFRARFKDIAERFSDHPSWYSVIDDLVQASVYAIDILLLAPAGGNENVPPKTRGAPKKKETAQRAEFAKGLIDQGLTWREIYEQYAKTPQGKLDKAASADVLRKAYERTYPVK
jgi:hypothetical protein